MIFTESAPFSNYAYDLHVYGEKRIVKATVKVAGFQRDGKEHKVCANRVIVSTTFLISGMENT